jgi:hypothetical protein
LGRIINPESAGKERNILIRAILVTLRELMNQTEINPQTKDLASFIALSLLEIGETIDASIGPWEKRGYWVKADRFRMEWVWTVEMGNQLRKAIIEENWQDVGRLSAKTMEKLSYVKIPIRHGIQSPWLGSWAKLIKINR